MKKELYHRFSVQMIAGSGQSSDVVHNEEVNTRIQQWLSANPQIESYRIINANIWADTKSSLPTGIQSAYTIVHIAYW